MKFIPNGHGAQLVDFPHFPSLLAFLRSEKLNFENVQMSRNSL